MIITFQPDVRQRAQLIWFCTQAGTRHEPGDVAGTLACHFDDTTELMAWHRDFVTCLGWAPMAIEVMVSDAEADF